MSQPPANVSVLPRLPVLKMEEGEEQQTQEEEEQQIDLPVIEKKEILETDTTEEFGQIFTTTEFDSWDEFTTLLEIFQEKTGSLFKPRSASSVEYANERRIHGPIPERFVYSNVKMICVHFGLPTKRGAGYRKNYVGKGCGAYMNLSYNRGVLKITQHHLIHTNHPLGEEVDKSLSRQLRVFNFTDEIDLTIAREVMQYNPFEHANGDKQWIMILENLQNLEDKFSTLSLRLLKKRVRYLVDKFLAFSHGKAPSSEDELGTILYELDRTRKEKMDNPAKREQKQKGPGRPRKKKVEEEEENVAAEEDDDSAKVEASPSPVRKRGRPPNSASQSTPSSTASSDLSTFLTYLQTKDMLDRKMRQEEIDLRKEELSLHKKEMELQKKRFDLDKIERQAHLDLIKAQMRALENSTANAKPLVPKDSGPVEYTIVVDNNNQHIYEAVPNIAVS